MKSMGQSEIVVMSLLVLWPVGSVVAQAPASRAPVSSTDQFVFYSDFRINAHDQLMQFVAAGDTARSACVAAIRF